MSSLYYRRQTIWLKFKNLEGKWTQRSSGLKVGQEPHAREILKALDKRVEAEKKVPTIPSDSVRSWAARWIKNREIHKLAIVAHYRARLALYILPRIGDMRISDVRVRHIADMMAEIRQSKLAPRTVRAIYSVANAMFSQALRHEVISRNPCALTKDDLPPKVDRDLGWRATAVFKRAEVEQIISDPRIPEWRRVFWALLFLSGMRFGEGAARTWADLDLDRQPLASLLVHSSWQSKSRSLKWPKTNQTRIVPVHPTLYTVLKGWEQEGWARAMGRLPKSQDPIVPNVQEHRFGGHMDVCCMLRRFHEDLDLLGLRRRRMHDTRRTFISLTLQDGGRRDLLRNVTHQRSQVDHFDDYTTIEFEALCKEVGMLKVTTLATSSVDALTRKLREDKSGSASDREPEERAAA